MISASPAPGEVAVMRRYATITGTRVNLAALRAAGFGLLVAPGCHRPWSETWPHGVMLDCGAWAAYRAGQPLRWRPLLRLWQRWQGRPVDAVVLGDIVCGGAASWAVTLATHEIVTSVLPGVLQLAPVQPDIPWRWIARWEGGYFVGGSTEAWKVDMCARLRRERPSAWIHVGRVNTRRRIEAIKAAGADAFDGSSASRYAVTAPQIAAWARRPVQLDLLGGGASA